MLEAGDDGTFDRTPPTTATRFRPNLPALRVGLWTHVLPAFFVLLPVVLTALVFWPGHMSADTLEQASEAATKHFTNSHSGILAAMWSVVWPLGVGPGWLFTGQLLCCAVGTFLVLRATLRPLAAGIATSLILLSPPVFGSLALLGRDMWFVAFIMLAFGFLVRAAQREWPARRWWLIASVVASWFALASRQNAATVVVIVGIGITALTLSELRPRWVASRSLVKRGLAWLVGGVVLTVALMATQTGLSAAIGIQNVHPEWALFVDDLAALSQREHRDLLPTSVMPAKDFPAVERGFTMDGGVQSIAWYPGAPISPPLTDKQVTALRKSWLHLVAHHPGDYLGERWTLFMRQIGVTRQASWVIHPQVDPNSFGFRTRFPSLDRIGMDYVGAFATPALDGETVMYRVWIYLLIALVVAVVLLRRGRRTELLIIGGLAVGAFTLQIGVFFGSPGVGYRLEHPGVLFAIVAGTVLVRWMIGSLASRRVQAGRAA